MRKIYSKLLLGLFFVVGTLSVNAQVMTNYSGANFVASSGTFTPLSGGTSVASILVDDAASAALPLGFTFYYMGKAYTQVRAGSDGYLSLVTLGIGSSITNNLATGTTVERPVIAPFWDDMDGRGAGAAASYLTTGAVGSRVFTFEWLNWARTGGTTPVMSFQVKLNENTGIIQFIYRSDATALSGATASIGLSAVATGSGNFVSLSDATAAPTTSTTVETTTISAKPATNQVYTFTPPQAVVADPTILTFTAVTVSGMTLNWVDNSTTETNFNIFRSTDGINYTYAATINSTTTAATGGAYNYSATGLSASTNYFWQVVANSEGVPSNPLSGSQGTLACTIAGGTYTVGATGTYTSVANALTALITNGITGAVVLELQTDYVPEGAITFGLVPCASLTNTVTIRPAAAVAAPIVLTSAAAAPTFNFNGGQFYIIDGRNGGSGTNKFITIANSITTGQAVQFINEGTSNVIKHCTIQGVNTSTTSGVIVFSTTTGTNGNDNNTIENCDIKDGATTPTNAIYSLGTTTTAQNNSGNTISNNNIFNYFSASSDHYGVNIVGGNTDWSITNNSFYQTSTRVVTSSTTTSGIRISSSTANNNLISGNYIGGTAPLCGSTALTYTGSATVGVIFRGLQLTVGSTTATSVQGNTIQNLSLSSGSTSTSQSGISLLTGRLNVGNVTGNTIGSQSLTNSIIFINSSTSTAQIFTAILAGTGTGDLTNISNNTIGGISISTSSTGATSLRGIGFQGTTGTFTISNNTIGSASTPNSITNATNSSVLGIFGSASIITATQNVNGNTVANIRSTSIGTSAQVIGILAQGSSGGIYNTSGNTVRDLTSTAPNIGTGSGASVIGISHTAATTAGQTVSQNTIYNISNSAISAATHLYGIHYSGPTTGTNLVAKNLIYNLNISSTSATATMIGINDAAGLATFQNNMIRMGIYDVGGVATSNTNGIVIVGIDKVSSTATNIYHNSVYIGGNGVTPGTANTIAFRRSASTPADEVRNNIFVNQRSGTGKHYVMGLNANAALTLSHNVYHGAGTGFTFGYVGIPGTTDYPTYGATWNTASGDASSMFADPQFVAPSAAIPNLHVQIGTPAEGTGILVASVVDDFDGQTRSTLSPTDIGADAGDYALVGIDMGATALVAPATSGCYTATETVTVTIKNFSATLIDFSVDNVTVNVTATGGYSSSVVLSSGTLAGGATQNVTMPATINMSTNGTYTFNANTVVSGDLNPGNDAMGAVNRIALTLGGTYTVGSGGNYANLTLAVSDFNTASCISGPIVFELTSTYSSTGETFPITINANAISGTNTLTIRPASGQNPIITGNSTTSIFKLNGADNVTIDGSNNGTSSRDLTIQNTTPTTSGNAVVWLASPALGNGATNNTIKNTIIEGNSSTTTFLGVFVGGNATISLTAAGTERNNNNTISNNLFRKTQNGLAMFGFGTATPDQNNIVSNNNFGTATAGEGFALIAMNLDRQENLIVSGNDVQNITNATTASNMFGIRLLDFKNGVAYNNKVHGITYTGTSTPKLYGIAVTNSTYTTVGNPSQSMIHNNFVYGITSSGTSGVWNSTGILAGAGYGDKYYYNSIHLTGQLNNSSSGLTAAFANGDGNISAFGTNLDVRNNIFNIEGSSLGGNVWAYYSKATNLTGTTQNYNLLRSAGTGATNNTGQLNAVNYTTLSAWQAGALVDANSVNGNPQFISATDLHINAAVTTPVESAGTPVSITVDIDGDTRNGTTPDIGADEGTFIAPAVNDVQATAFIDPTNGGSKITGVAFSPIASFTNNGTANQTNVPVRYRIVDATLVEIYNQTGTIATLNSGVTSNFTFPGTTIATAGTYTIYAKAELVGDEVPSNDQIVGTLLVEAPLCGTYMVGASQPSGFQNLTQAIGKLNSLGISCSVIFELQSDYSSASETYPLTINSIPGASNTATFTLRPASGISPVITGTNATALIDINNGDYITIDGSNNGSSTKNLTISNTNTSGAVVRFINDATNNTIKNCILNGVSTSLSNGIVFFSTTTGTSGNDNNTIQNNDIAAGATAYAYGILNSGTTTSTALKNSDLQIIGNNVFNFSNTGIRDNGGSVGAIYSGNQIYQVNTQTTSLTGFRVGSTTIEGVTFTRNRIFDLKTTGTGTVYGIHLFDIFGSVSLVGELSNNMIALDATTPLTMRGIYDQSTVGEYFNVYYNSVSITGTVTGASNSEAYYWSIASITNARNNIFSNTRTGGTGKHYAIRTNTTLANIVSDYNDIYNSGGTANVFGNDGTADRANLGAWQAATLKDANSISIQPVFVSATDLHLVTNANCGIDGKGTPIAGLTIDYDSQVRNATTPDPGADEFDRVLSNVLYTTFSSYVCDNRTIDPAGTDFVTNACNIITRVVPNGGAAVSGTVSACVFIDPATVPTYNTEPYLQRHIDILPSTAPFTSTGRVTFYALQSEFDVYNANNGGFPDMPTAPGDAVGIANLQVTVFKGSGTSPGSGPAVRIDPVDTDIIWNATNNWWEISFDVTGFGGFYLHTSRFLGPLPISINYFRGTKQGSNHLLNWKVTCNSTPKVTLTLQRSSNAAGGFNDIYSLEATSARCDQPFDYTDAQPLTGMNYYRLMMTDIDGNVSYSSIVALLNAIKGFEIVGIAPNPTVNGQFKLNVTTTRASTMEVIISDMQGRIVQRRQVSLINGFNAINMNAGNLANGTYLLYGITDEGNTRTLPFIKQ